MSPAKAISALSGTKWVLWKSTSASRVMASRVSGVAEMRDDGVVAEDHLRETLRRQEPGLGSLLNQAGLRSRFQARPLLSRERRIQQDIGGQLEQLRHVLGERTAGHGGERARGAAADSHRRRHRLELLRDLLRCFRRRAFAHHLRGVGAEADHRRRIEVATCAGDDDLEGDAWQAVIFEHHEVQTVRQVCLLWLRQRHLENVIRDRRLAFDDQAGARRRLPLAAGGRLRCDHNHHNARENGG